MSPATETIARMYNAAHLFREEWRSAIQLCSAKALVDRVTYGPENDTWWYDQAKGYMVAAVNRKEFKG